MRGIIFDLEATGLSPEKGDVIIDVAAIRVGPDGIEDRYQSLVSAGSVEVSPFIAALTGISAEMLSTAPSWENVREELRAFFGNELPIYGHNVQFDMHFLAQKGLPLAASRFVDSCDFATLYFPEAPSHSLEVLSSYLRLPHTEKHRAMGDVLATYELLRVLAHERDADPMHDKVLHVLQAKGTQWSGKHFYNLAIPSAQVPHVLPSVEQDSALQIPGPGTRVARIRPSVPRFLELVYAQPMPTVSLVSPAEMETARDAISSMHDMAFFDHPSQMVTVAVKKHFADLDVWTAEETLFALRLLRTDDRRFPLHQSALSITHREKFLLPRFAVDESCIPELFAKKGHVIMTYHAWHTFKDHIPADARFLVSDAMRLEMHLHASSKAYLSFDQLTSRLKNISARAEEHGVSVSEHVAKLEFVLRYMFTGLAKLLRSDQKEVSLTDTPEFILSFGETWAKGLQTLREHVAGTEAEIALDSLITLAEEQVYNCIQRLTDARYMSIVSRLPQGVMLVQERTDLAEEKAWFENRDDVVLAMGYTDGRLSPFIPVQEIVEIDPLSLPNVHLDRECSQELSASFSPVDALSMLGKQHNKLMVCPGSGSHLDKVFDALYAGLHGELCTVLANGKTGGRGKVRYSFLHQDKAIVVANAADAKGMGVEADALIITSLPFPATMSAYWREHYGDQNFGTLSLPLLLQQLVDLVWSTAKSDGMTVYITDQRLFEKPYGREVLELFADLRK